MSPSPAVETKAPGTPVPAVSAAQGFITITNTLVVMLGQLADEVRMTEPGTAEVITAFTESLAGAALDLIASWPS